MSKSQIDAMISQGERFITCFQFYLNNESKIYLTSSDQKVTYENICYMPNSGISIDSCYFNDSAHNEIKLKGIFEKGGIDKNLDLDSMNVKIFFHFPEKALFLEWLELGYSEIQYDGMSFVLTLKSEIFKLHKSLLQNFSTNCRANFGDSKCKVQSIVYSAIYDVVSIFKDTIKISGCTRPDGFFTGGSMSFNDGSSYEIKSHMQHSLIVTKHCAQHWVSGSLIRVTLTPSCDKNFITCCNKYNNAVNFPGEPNIPWCQ